MGADGPLTVLGNALCTVSSSNSLVCLRGTTSGSATPTQAGLNVRVVVNNGALVVAPAAAYTT